MGIEAEVEALAAQLAGWHSIATGDGDHVKADLYSDVETRLRKLLATPQPTTPTDADREHVATLGEAQEYRVEAAHALKKARFEAREARADFDHWSDVVLQLYRQPNRAIADGGT